MTERSIISVSSSDSDAQTCRDVAHSSSSSTPNIVFVDETGLEMDFPNPERIARMKSVIESLQETKPGTARILRDELREMESAADALVRLVDSGRVVPLMHANANRLFCVDRRWLKSQIASGYRQARGVATLPGGIDIDLTSVTTESEMREEEGAGGAGRKRRNVETKDLAEELRVEAEREGSRVVREEMFLASIAPNRDGLFQFLDRYKNAGPERIALAANNIPRRTLQSFVNIALHLRIVSPSDVENMTAVEQVRAMLFGARRVGRRKDGKDGAAI